MIRSYKTLYSEAKYRVFFVLDLSLPSPFLDAQLPISLTLSGFRHSRQRQGLTEA